MSAHRFAPSRVQAGRGLGIALLLSLLLPLFAAPATVRGADPDPPAALTESLLAGFEQQRRAMADRMERATVYVLNVEEDGNEYSSGSGFFIADGLIMTNGHVVEGKGSRIYLVMNTHLPPTRARLVALEYDGDSAKGGRDFALLRISPPGESRFPHLAFSTDVRRMDRVSAWGYPGIVSMFDRSIDILENSSTPDIVPPPLVYTEGTISAFVEKKGKSIIHSASIASGNSGGPLINHHGAVVGINTWGHGEEDEGVYVNAALTSESMVAFLRSHGITPLMADDRRPPPENAPLVATPGRAPAGEKPRASDESGPQKPSSPQGGSFMEALLGAPAPPVSADASARPAAPAQAPSPARPEDSGQRDDPRITASGARASLSLAENGDTDAMTLVGLSYSDGSDDFPQDSERARHWLDMAANRGNVRAQGLLGMLYLMDEDLRDPESGLSWLYKAAKSSGEVSVFQAHLSAVLFDGRHLGIHPDYEESLFWAESAARAGQPMGKAMLGLHYFEGVGVDKDLQRARTLADEAASAGDSKGVALQVFLRYLDGEFNDDPQLLIRLAEEAAYAGEAYAQGMLASVHAFDDQYADYAKAEKWARLAAAQAHYMGQYVLGWLYLNGTVVEKNYAMAWAYLDLAMQDAEDMEVDPDGPLLAKVESLMSAADRKKGRKIQQSWLVDWGLGE